MGQEEEEARGRKRGFCCFTITHMRFVRYVQVKGDVDINKSVAQKHKLLNESGAPLSKRYRTTKYEQWTQRTKKSIPQLGDQESKKPVREHWSKFKKFKST